MDVLAEELLKLEGVVGFARSSPVTLFVESEEVIEKLPRTLDTEKVDYRVVGKLKPLTQLMVEIPWRTRPLVGGVSVSPDMSVAGTLGICFEDGTAITNAHVVSMNFSSGEYIGPGNPVYQPAFIDGGSEEDLVGYVQSYIRLDPGLPNRVDASLIRLVEGFTPWYVQDIGMVDGLGVPEEGMNIRKYGRTTGLTEGTVTYTGATVVVDYELFGDMTFEDVLIIEPAIVDNGDSGSVAICSNANKLVGLNFAGSDYISVSIPIQNVLSAFEQEYTTPSRIAIAMIPITLLGIMSVGNLI